MAESAMNPTDWDTLMQEMRRLTGEPDDLQEELERLRRRMDMETELTHRRIIERVSQEAGVDLHSILEDAQRRKAVKRRYFTRAMNKLEAKAGEQALARKKQYVRVRDQYLKDFAQYYKNPDRQGDPVLKFQVPFQWHGDATPAISECLADYPGNYEASADMVASSDKSLVVLHPHIKTDNGDCEENTGWARTVQNIFYRMEPLSSAFEVVNTRVDLLGFGVASGRPGDTGCFFNNLSFQSSEILLKVFIAQWVNKELHFWPLVTSTLFSRAGSYTTPVELLVSGETYPTNIILRSREAGGGEVVCILQLVCKSIAVGSNARAQLDFTRPDLGMWIWGVDLMGDYL